MRCARCWRRQIGAPNSPQWFNTGLHWAYGISGPAQGHYYVDPKTARARRVHERVRASASAHACFIQSVKDDLVNEGGIMDLWVREARIFKHGSGTGSNFSEIRGEGEKLSGGGTSVRDLMSFLRVGDRAAGAIKSGGTTRRAAKMVVLEPRSSGHRRVHHVESYARSRKSPTSLPDRSLRKASQCDHESRARRVAAASSAPRSGAEPGAQGRDSRGACASAFRRRTSSTPSTSRSRATKSSRSRRTTRIGIRRRTERFRGRTRTTRFAFRTSSSRASMRARSGTSRRARTATSLKDVPAEELWEKIGARGLAMRRSRRCNTTHDQRVAHVRSRRTDQRNESVH